MVDPQQSMLNRLLNQQIENQRLSAWSLPDNPFGVGYGWHIKWTKLDGSIERFSVEGAPSLEEAQRQVEEWATRNGWTPPKWWQWWRWRDTKRRRIKIP